MYLIVKSQYTMSMPRVPNKVLKPLNLGDEDTGKRIARIRKKRGYTQQDLADVIGITREALSAYENGRNRLYDEMVSRFALALETTTDEILGLSSANQPKGNDSLKVTRRIRQIEELPQAKQKAILQSLDMMIDSAQRGAESPS